MKRWRKQSPFIRHSQTFRSRDNVFCFSEGTYWTPRHRRPQVHVPLTQWWDFYVAFVKCRTCSVNVQTAVPFYPCCLIFTPSVLTWLPHHTPAAQIYPDVDRPVWAGCSCCDWCLLCRAGRSTDQPAAGDAVPAGHGWEAIGPEPETLWPGFQWGERTRWWKNSEIGGWWIMVAKPTERCSADCWFFDWLL